MSFPFDAIFILGPQGSGKGTQARVLSDKLGFRLWDTGAVLRRHEDKITSSGERTGDILASGRLFTDEELMSVVKEELERLRKDEGVVFDGIPRRIGQAKFMFEFLKAGGKERFATLFIDVPQEESIKRLLLRAEKEKRTDDTREVIEKRLEDYHANTVPMLGFLKEHTEFFEIDGRSSVEKVTKSIFEMLGIE